MPRLRSEDCQHNKPEKPFEQPPFDRLLSRSIQAIFVPKAQGPIPGISPHRYSSLGVDRMVTLSKTAVPEVLSADVTPKPM